jgi:type IV pilus assembly protein PilB
VIVESQFRESATSHAGAAGMWQFMPGTGRLYGLEVSEYVDERRDPVRSTDAAVRHLGDLHRQFGSWHLALAAYNAGAGRVGRALRGSAGRRADEVLYWRIRPRLPGETRRYVPLYLAAAEIARDPEAFGLRPRREPPLAFAEAWVPGGVALDEVARRHGVPPATLRQLNPHLVRDDTAGRALAGARSAVVRINPADPHRMNTAPGGTKLPLAPQHAQDRVAEALLAEGVVTPDQVEAAGRARDAEAGARGGLLFHLIELGAVTAPQVRGALEAEFGQATLDLGDEAPDRRVVGLVPAALARELGVAAVGQVGQTLQLAMRGPFDTDALARLRGQTGLDVQPVLADEHSLWLFLERCYAGSDELTRTAGLAIAAVRHDEEVLGTRRSDAVEQKVREAAVPAFVREVLHDAVRRRASDVHFEVYEDHTRVRYRIDGKLVETRRVDDPRVAGHIAGHIKYLATMRSASDRMPQDGALTLAVDGRDVQFRVGTLPTVHGEKVVLRVLDYSDVPTDLGQLGIEGREREVVERAMRAKKGMLLVTGPTGSGKSTTLAAVLTALNRPDINILSVEDPVERKHPGIQQVQVLPHETDPRLDRSFAAVLRAFLRQDPDVIMVGEIRDLETGSIAIKAALTGHLVLSTLHTNDAPSTITRMVDMGIERFVIAGALHAIVAQRLVRRVCPRCAESYVPAPEELRAAGFAPGDVERREFRRGTGRTPAGARCEPCGGSGYRGRIGLFEVLEVTPAIRRAIIEGRTEADIGDLARAEGMRTLREAAQAHALASATTLAEVIEETTL